MIKSLFLVDDQDDREIFQEALSNCDPNILFLFACDGLEALNTLEFLKNMPDVIFVDYFMPRMNGIDLLKSFSLNRKTRSIPTVLYSTSAGSEEDRFMLLSGADYFLKKHSAFSHLCSELKAMLEMIDDSLTAPRI